MLQFHFDLVDDLIAPGASRARVGLTVRGRHACLSMLPDCSCELTLMIVGLLDVVRHSAVCDGVSEVEFPTNEGPFVLRFRSHGGFIDLGDAAGRRLHSGTTADLVTAAKRDIVPFAEHLCRCFGPTDPTRAMLRDELDDFETVIDARV